MIKQKMGLLSYNGESGREYATQRIQEHGREKMRVIQANYFHSTEKKPFLLFEELRGNSSFASFYLQFDNVLQVYF